MRKMFRNLERNGFVIVGPPEHTTILRMPPLSEFRAAATAAGLPTPRNWDHFYECIFGERPEPEVIPVQSPPDFLTLKTA